MLEQQKLRTENRRIQVSTYIKEHWVSDTKPKTHETTHPVIHIRKEGKGWEWNGEKKLCSFSLDTALSSSSYKSLIAYLRYKWYSSSQKNNDLGIWSRQPLTIFKKQNKTIVCILDYITALLIIRRVQCSLLKLFDVRHGE